VGLLFSPLASQDLEAIGDYIAKDNPARALKFVNEIREQCKKISERPLMYRSRPELGVGIRSCPYGDYLIIFRPDIADVLIVRVLHGVMDISARLNENNS